MVYVEKNWGTAEVGEELPDNEKEKFFVLAWSLGVTTPENLLRYHQDLRNPKAKGVEGMNDLYMKVILLTREIWERAERLNPKLYEDLTEPNIRQPQWGKYERDCVGDDYFTHIAAVSTPAGWAGPRVLKEMLDKSFKWTDAALDSSLKESTAPSIFLCKLAEDAYKLGVSGSSIMDLVLKKHLYDEQNYPEMFSDVVQTMEEHAPRLYKEAQKLAGEYELKGGKVPGWVGIFNNCL